LRVRFTTLSLCKTLSLAGLGRPAVSAPAILYGENNGQCIPNIPSRPPPSQPTLITTVPPAHPGLPPMPTMNVSTVMQSSLMSEAASSELWLLMVLGLTAAVLLGCLIFLLACLMIDQRKCSSNPKQVAPPSSPSSPEKRRTQRAATVQPYSELQPTLPLPSPQPPSVPPPWRADEHARDADTVFEPLKLRPPPRLPSQLPHGRPPFVPPHTAPPIDYTADGRAARMMASRIQELAKPDGVERYRPRQQYWQQHPLAVPPPTGQVPKSKFVQYTHRPPPALRPRSAAGSPPRSPPRVAERL